MNTFYSDDELKKLGLGSYGEDVKISRNAIIYHPEEVNIGNHVRIDDFTTISGKVTLNNYIHIAQACNLYGGEKGIVMEDFSAISAKCLVYATTNDYSGEFLTNPTVPDKYTKDINALVHIGRHVVVGCGSIMLPGVDIKEGCAIGAMSLVNKSTEEWGIYVGSPAKKLRDREKGVLEREKEFTLEKQNELL